MPRPHVALICIALCLVWLLPPAPAQQAAYSFKAVTNIVLVNLSVKDDHGNPVKDLKQSEVTILEDGKPQHIASFDFENVDAPVAAEPSTAAAAADNGPAGTVVAGAKPVPKPKPAATVAAPTSNDQYSNRRLIVLYFDLTTMQPEDVQNVVEQAQTYVQKHMDPADMVAIASLGDSLQVNQDFTSDKDALMKVLRGLNPATSSGFEAGDDGSTDTGSSFVADSSEFNIANADRSLESLQSMCDMLGKIPQKKSLMYYSSGVQRSGVDNEITLRSSVNSCVKANVSIYGTDARGMQALPPGGNATAASQTGTSAFNGGAQMSTLNSNFAQQETIATLSNDTGGKSFLDSNDFGPVYTQVQKDTQAYYLIGYSSTNAARDGKYRKITVKINRPGVVANARPGYYASKDINHLSTADRQQQLQDELNADVSDHSLDLYVADGYLRLDATHYYVPLSVTIPGNEIPLHGVNPKATPEVDVAGELLDQAGRQLNHVQQTIQLNASVTGGAAQQLQNRNLQYNTGFILAPGQKYQIRFAARENQSGQMGAFETVVTLPDLDKVQTQSQTALEMSSVFVGNQLVTTRPDPDDPLTASGTELIQNVSHVFSANQHLYIYYEVYDPKLIGADGTKLLTDVSFFRGRVKAFETQNFTVNQMTDPRRKAAVIQVDIPLSELKPGYYICQVNAVDDAAGRFAFPRIPILIRPVAAATAAASKP